VARVLAEARCGDVLLTTGLSYSEVQYYWRRQQAPDCILVEAYPGDIALHPGWLDNSDAAALEAEARQRAGRLASVRGARVWLFYDRDRDNSFEPLKAALDRQLSLVQEFSLRGTAFDVVYLYSSE
jgi:hypothetical protein